MNYFIRIQNVDFEEYPVGSPTNVGPFESKVDAERFMEASSKFRKVGLFGYEYWSLRDSHANVDIRSVTSIFTNPDDYEKRRY